MDVVWLSRLQFAAAAFFHFLFVPLTLGLSFLIAIMETRWAKTGDVQWQRMAKFWGKIFLVNFGIGVITGITLEFQFGTNWSEYSKFVGDIFGSLLAIEASLAFFLESTFIAVWVFGWKRLSAKAHAAVMWVIAIASTTSAFWILAANAFMQHPVGYVMRNGRLELDNFWELIFHWTAWLLFIHTVTGAFALAGFFVMGVSAWHLLRGSHKDFFHRSFRMGMWMALAGSILVAISGDEAAVDVANIQPAKLAAMEAIWESRTHAPEWLLIIPDEKNERNLVEIGEIPSLLSILAYRDAKARVTGMKDIPPDERPPVTSVFIAFRLMVGLGTLMILLSVSAWHWRKKPERHPWFLRIMIWAIPIPYIALQAGWFVTEVGRQPWIVYGVLRTSEAASPVPGGQVLATLIAFLMVYGLLGIAALYMMARFAKRGPAPTENEEENGGFQNA